MTNTDINVPNDISGRPMTGNIRHPNSISVLPANSGRINAILVLGRASDIVWRWETEDGFKHLHNELEAKLLPGDDPFKQDLVLTMARLVWIQRELTPKNPIEAKAEILEVLLVSTAQLTQQTLKEFANNFLAERSK